MYFCKQCENWHYRKTDCPEVNGPRCVACGELLTEKTIGNHHCDPKRERALEGGRKGHAELGREHVMDFHERLSEGMRMLDESGDDEWGD